MGPRAQEALVNTLTNRCLHCDCLKPPHSHHCSTCEACVLRMDHHCPWVNNCVGYSNQKFFLQFLLHVFLGTVYAMILIGITSWNCYVKRCNRTFGKDILPVVIGKFALIIISWRSYFWMYLVWPIHLCHDV